MRFIASHFALLPEGIVRNPLVGVTDDGRIASVGEYDPSSLDSSAGVEFHAGILIPAFVNAHTHLELSYLRGAIPPACGYAGFAAAMARTRNAFTAEERHAAAVAADREMFDAGIIAAGDIANDDSAFAAKASGKVLYRTFAEVFGLRTPSFASAEPLTRHPSTTLTPHSVYSLNDEPFRRICNSGEGVLSIHFMESPAESDLFAGRGSLKEWYSHEGFECDFLHYGSPAQRLVASVPSDRSVMLVHCCCVTQRDIDIIEGHFTAPVWWVVCPRSNHYISGLGPDIALLRRNRLRICTGTDSLASNRSLSILDELKMLDGVPLDELLTWATANGADALGLCRGTGRLRPDSACGLAVVSGFDTRTMTLTGESSLRRLV